MSAALPTGVVTLLFSDIEGSSKLLAQAADDYGQLLAEHRALLREAFLSHGGVEVDTQGDAFFVAFSTPVDAVAAAEAAHAGLAAHDWRGHPPVRVRIGVHAGTPQRGPEGYWGADVHYGARLGAAAHGGQTLVSAVTAGLLPQLSLRSLGEHAFKDFPEPREVFEAGGPAASFAPIRSLDPRRRRLPVVESSFVGREGELAEASALLGEHRLVTILGPGGSGKTRLAVETAHALEEYAEICFVPLESIADPEQLEAAIARALELPGDSEPAAQLRGFLADRDALLVLDNVEHLLDAASRIADLLAAAPGLRVLVTSQAPLRIRAEHLLRLGPLAAEAEGDAAEAPAVRLLLDRVRAAGEELTVDADVVELVRRLEGMPLAIELAAGRLGVASASSLLRQLDRGLDVLGAGGRDLPARQRGLRAVLDWTCSLLSDADRELLAGLAAFGGDVDADLVDLAFPGAFDGLTTLRDVGLVVRTRTGRLMLRPPVRRYAATLVDDETRREQHRAVARALVELAAPYERRWLVEAGAGHAVLDDEEANVLAALEWCRDAAPEEHAQLAGAYGWWTMHRNLARIGRRHVDLAIARAPEDPVLQARLFSARGVLGLEDRDPTWCKRAAEAWSGLGDLDGVIVNLTYASNLAMHHGEPEDVEEAVSLGRRALELARERSAATASSAGPGTDPVESVVASTLAIALWESGDQEGAMELASDALAGDYEDAWVRAWITTGSGDLALNAGDFERALQLYGTCLGQCAELRMPLLALLQAVTIVEALLGLGRVNEAIAVRAVCAHVHRELGYPMRESVARVLARSREALDEASSDDAELARAAARATELGVTGGLAWVERLAVG